MPTWLPKVKKPDLGNKVKDLRLSAAVDYLTCPRVKSDHLLEPIPEQSFQVVKDHLFGPERIDNVENWGDISEDSRNGEAVQKPPKKKRKRTKPNNNNSARRIRSVMHEVEAMVEKAMVNRFVAQHYSFEDALKGKQFGDVDKVITFDDEIPRSIWSNDGVLLGVHLPGLIKDRGKQAITDNLIDFALICPPSRGATRVSRGNEQVYVEADNPDRIVGEVRISRGWNAIGRKGADTQVVSRDMLRSCKMFMQSCNLISELELLAHRINSCIKVADPEFYQHLLEFREKHKDAQVGTKALSSIDPLLFENRELLYNVRLTRHVDSQDPRRSLAAFAVFGKFTGGYMRYASLGVRVRAQAGDMNLLRGRMVPHEIEEFEGQRISIPHFTHSSCWKSVGMLHLVD